MTKITTGQTLEKEQFEAYYGGRVVLKIKVTGTSKKDGYPIIYGNVTRYLNGVVVGQPECEEWFWASDF